MTTDRYHDALNNLPPPGAGCHTALLSVANLGARAGVSPDALFDDLRQAIPSGSRRVSDREILDAVNKAMTDHNGGTFTPAPKPKPVVKNGDETLRAIINMGKHRTVEDLKARSPIRIYDQPPLTTHCLLMTCFREDEYIFIGDRLQNGVMGDTIRTRGEWVKHILGRWETAPFVIVNPLSGKPAPKKSGEGTTLRGDGNVAEYRHCLIEFDDLSREDQVRFWSAARLPLVALVDSGNKSLHAWVAVPKLAPVKTAAAWQKSIKGDLYDRLLTPMGVDPACSNPARLSRLPGHYRAEKESWQRLLWLSPLGRPVCR